MVPVAGGSALALRRPGPPSRRCAATTGPGSTGPAGCLFLVPVLGVALMAMSEGDWSYSDGWVLGGLALWAVAAAFVAELALWPG